MKFRNPLNGYEEKARCPWLWCLMFGSLYFAVRGIWSHAVISLVFAVTTGGVSWIIYPFFASGIVRKNYLRRGWEQIHKGDLVMSPEDYREPRFDSSSTGAVDRL